MVRSPPRLQAPGGMGKAEIAWRVGEVAAVALAVCGTAGAVGGVEAMATGVAGALAHAAMRWAFRSRGARGSEHERLLRDLHDGLGAELTGLVVRVRAMESAARDPEARRALGEVATAARGALGELRSIVHGRGDRTTNLGDVVADVQRRCRDLCRDSELVVSCDEGTASIPIDGGRAACLRRFVQEAVRNAVIHGRARRVVVDLASDGGLVLTVADDGIGFDAARTDGGGRGLANLHARAVALGGGLQRWTVPAGARVRLTLGAGATMALAGPPPGRA